MTKAHADFLEELKNFCSEKAMQGTGLFEGNVVYSDDIIKMIEQFEAEKEQVSDEIR